MPEYIKQTSRTILFEEFSHPENDPLRMEFFFSKDLNTTLDKIKSNLMVNSFEQFMDKFEPKYYECIGVDEQGNFSIEYTIDKNRTNLSEFKFTEHNLRDQPFFKAIMKIYNDKKNSGQNNYEFDYGKLTEAMFSPQKAMQDAIELRDRLTYNYNEYCKLEERGASLEETEDYVSEVIRLRRQIRDEYLSKSVLNILPLAIAEAEKRLELTTVPETEDGKIRSTIQPAIPVFTKKGLKYISVEKQQISNNQLPGGKKIPLLSSIIGDDFDSAVADGKNQLTISQTGRDKNEQKMIADTNKMMKELIISTFVPNCESNQITKQSSDILKNNINTFQKMYKASQESFSNSVVSLLKKVLNVKAFFDNAGGNAELIISNCPIKKLVDNEKEKFEAFIKKMGSETTDERIWFAIIPGIYDDKINDNIKYKKQNNDITGPLDSSSEIKSDVSNLTTLNEFKSAIEILGNAKIITFFNFLGDEKTSFRTLSEKKIEDYKEVLASVQSLKAAPKYAVFCYPNFELLPKKKSSVEIGKNEFGKTEYINLPSVYIDSSYVAAALYVKSQNLSILKKAGFSVDNSLEQPVRFDFEIDFDTNTDKKVPLAQAFPTNISRELILTWSEELKEEINKDGGFGFCFCGDEKWVTYGGKTYRQDKIYVYRARTLEKDKESGRTRPIYKSMIQTYLEIMAKKTSSAQIESRFNEFNSIKSDYYINNILYSPKTSSLKIRESISKNNNKITIVYDKDRDSFDLDFQEETSID